MLFFYFRKSIKCIFVNFPLVKFFKNVRFVTFYILELFTLKHYTKCDNHLHVFWIGLGLKFSPPDSHKTMQYGQGAAKYFNHFKDRLTELTISKYVHALFRIFCDYC